MGHRPYIPRTFCPKCDKYEVTATVACPKCGEFAPAPDRPDLAALMDEAASFLEDRASTDEHYQTAGQLRIGAEHARALAEEVEKLRQACQWAGHTITEQSDELQQAEARLRQVEAYDPEHFARALGEEPPNE